MTKRMHSDPFSSEEILKIIDEWHDGDDMEFGKPVWYYMGWTKEQYRHWVQTGEQPE